MERVPTQIKDSNGKARQDYKAPKLAFGMPLTSLLCNAAYCNKGNTRGRLDGYGVARSTFFPLNLLLRQADPQLAAAGQ